MKLFNNCLHLPSKFTMLTCPPGWEILTNIDNYCIQHWSNSYNKAYNSYIIYYYNDIIT